VAENSWGKSRAEEERSHSGTSFSLKGTLVTLST
jgi:hypothetical protein